MNIDCGGGAWERGGKKPDSAEISSFRHVHRRDGGASRHGRPE